MTGLSFDDLDGNMECGHESRSFTHGPKPIVKLFRTASDEASFITQEIKKLIDTGVNANDICVVTRTKRLLDSYASAISAAGMRCFEIKQSKADDRSMNGVRLATMHRIKGLEFEYVFAAAVNDGIVPLEAAIDHTDLVSENETLKTEKCLIYVALTRTRRCAYVTCFGRPSTFLPNCPSS